MYLLLWKGLLKERLSKTQKKDEKKLVVENMAYDEYYAYGICGKFKLVDT